MNIIDRRREGGKSLANRQRFIRRARALVKRAVREASAGRSIKDVEKGGDIVVPAGGVHEPVLRKGSQGGTREYVLPGNKKYIQGDTIARPEEDGGGSGASDGGEGEDDFRFALSDEEFLDLFLEDLELPDLAKRQVMGVEETQPQRAGFKSSGSPSSLSVSRTMRNSLSRRTALGRPRPQDVAAIEAEIARLDDIGGNEEKIAALREDLERKQKRMRLVPFIDPLDVRYRRFDQVPKPVARAVMFCLMDVSGSMDEHMKDLAKRFYSLLYLFLKRRYGRVDVVFIRHTHEAREVDEETFFHSRESGGTVVSTALEEMTKIVHDRYPANQWNIYGAQASDGDNLPMDNSTTINLLKNAILPLCQYYAYLEVGHAKDDGGDATSLWRAYELVAGSDDRMAMRKVSHRRDIYPVFRELFAKGGAKAEAS
ncbi:MAG: YeaH/YhbH family protein [Alphaproteobacteria bacterium]|nr:MAG: YeaH/YhbH family protein [Alphaproteobacteria bacterium]